MNINKLNKKQLKIYGKMILQLFKNQYLKVINKD